MPARLNINRQEVLNLHGHEGDLWCSVFMAQSPFQDWSEERGHALYERFPSVIPRNRRYKPGGTDQLRGYICADEFKEFVTVPDILSAIRQFNHRLMQRGPCIYGRYHCMDLADGLLTIPGDEAEGA